MESVYFFLLSFPPWSLAAHCAAGLVVLAAKSRLSSVQGSRQWHLLLNEFLSTFLWVCWTLECLVIASASSNLHSLFALFLRLLVWPVLFGRTCVNPCNSVFLAVERHSLSLLPPLLLTQLLAMCAGLGYSLVLWQLLAAWLSQTHFEFMGSEATPFLNVSLWLGFFLEMAMSFSMYLPRLLMRTYAVQTQTVLSALWTCLMIYCLDKTTGAFMNPLIATSCRVVQNSFPPGTCLEILFVYWVAPLSGALLASTIYTQRTIPHQKEL